MSNLIVPPPSERLMTDREFASTLGVDERTPAQWRYIGKFRKALPYFKIGRSVRYRESDVIAFLASCQVGGVPPHE